MRHIVVARFVLLFIVAAMLFQAVFDAAPVAQAAGTTYYVAPAGADSNPGTLAAPFATIQQCASVAKAGDTCLIRAGTYRETVKPAASGAVGNPITFAAYPNEQVTVSGTDPLRGWTLDGGSVYRASMPWTMVSVPTSFAESRDRIGDQLFVDGQMLVEARWPNIPLARATELRRDDNVLADDAAILAPNIRGDSNQAVYTSTQLAQVANRDWRGGYAVFMPGYGISANSCAITNLNASAVSVACPPGDTFKDEDRYHQPTKQNPFYLAGSRAALDSPGEWFRERHSGQLYLWMPDGGSPVGRQVEAKRRLYAFDLKDRSDIVVRGIDLFAASVETSENSRRVSLREMNMAYVWHFGSYRALAWDDGDIYGMIGRGGLVLEGDELEIVDSEIAYSAASGVVFHGRNNRVVNTVIRNTGYMGGSDAVTVNNNDPGTKHRLAQSTIFNAGRIAVNASRTARGPGGAIDVLYNDIYRSHLQAVDLGAIYSWTVDGQNSQIAYNLVHDITPVRNDALRYYGAYGIYLDDDTYNYLVHHNIVWNTTNAGIGIMGNSNNRFTPPLSPTDPRVADHNRIIINNTIDNSDAPIAPAQRVGLLAQRRGANETMFNGTEFINNLASSSGIPTGTNLVAQTNLSGTSFWADRANRDYRLATNATAAINTGTERAPFTDGFAGAKPDIGALEAGVASFAAGATLRQRDLAGLVVNCTPDASSKTARCIASELPLGRSLPGRFELRIGTGAGSTCTDRMDYNDHQADVTCAGVAYGNQTGLLPIEARIGSGPWTPTSSSLQIGPAAAPAAPTLTQISPAQGSVTGGTRVILQGTNFATTGATYRLPITVANNAGRAVADYPVLLTLNTKALIEATPRKLQPDCRDLRFNDTLGNLEYWIEEGCGGTATRVWVKLAYLAPEGGQIWATYGDNALSAASSAAKTFLFYDDFADGVANAKLEVVTSGGVTVGEADGQMRIAGTTQEANQYESLGFRINPSLVEFPLSYALEASVSAVLQPGSDTFPKIGVGGADSVLMVYADYTTPNGDRKAGYWDGTQWVARGGSDIDAPTFSDQKVRMGYVNERDVYYYENDVLKADHKNADTGYSGFFAYSPNAAGRSFDVRFDDVRLRPFVFPEPVASFGSEVAPGKALSVSIGGKPCTRVVVAQPTSLTCVTPAGTAGAADVVVTNPDDQRATLAGGFTYVTTPDPVDPDPIPNPDRQRRVYLPLTSR